MRYALLLATENPPDPCHEDRTERFAAFVAFIDEMHERGVLADHGLRLQSATTATAVRKRAGELVIADGPFAETKEQIVGLFLVDCEDLDEAIEVASKVPLTEYGTVEVRPVWEI
jgi:hypothetical protein